LEKEKKKNVRTTRSIFPLASIRIIVKGRKKAKKKIGSETT